MAHKIRIAGLICVAVLAIAVQFAPAVARAHDGHGVPGHAGLHAHGAAAERARTIDTRRAGTPAKAHPAHPDHGVTDAAHQSPTDQLAARQAASQPATEQTFLTAPVTDPASEASAASPCTGGCCAGMSCCCGLLAAAVPPLPDLQRTNTVPFRLVTRQDGRTPDGLRRPPRRLA